MKSIECILNLTILHKSKEDISFNAYTRIFISNDSVGVVLVSKELTDTNNFAFIKVYNIVYIYIEGLSLERFVIYLNF